MSNQPSLIYRGAPGTQNLGNQALQAPQTQPEQEKKKPVGIVKKDIVIPETMANKAIKIGVSGVIGVAVGFLADRIVKNKPITWFLLGSTMALGFELVKKD